ncbi:hypothetical protein [Leisingera sp. NJS204]|nr:hypothetical protein [Leisingera sp. NJS204]
MLRFSKSWSRMLAQGVIAGAAIIALAALNVLAAALVAALIEAGIDTGWAALIIDALFGGWHLS